MQHPSNSQLKAIQHGEGPMLVLAGPGSGKTFVMIQRILYLIQIKHIRPDKILVISFSKASVLELKQRLKKQFINNNQNLSIEQVQVSTFHSCFFHILRESCYYNVEHIIKETEKREILKTILLEPKFEIQGETSKLKQEKAVLQEYKIAEKIEEYLEKISYYKSKGVQELKQKESLEFQKIFYAYNNEMHERHRLDFDDMGMLCLKLFQTKIEILEKWRQKFEYILIDEFQDINEIQFRNIQLLAEKHQNLFVVGDDDQAIYSFRGASPKFMLDFKKYYPNAEMVLLDINFRCSKTIVEEAKKVIQKNRMRYPKEITAFQNITEPVEYRGFENQQKEFSYLKEQVTKIVKQTGNSYSEIACIYRTNQDMQKLADYLIRNKIPFVMKEQCNSIFRHEIALDILAYLQFFMGGKHRRDFIRIMNKPLRYFSRFALTEEIICYEKLERYYQEKEYMRNRILELKRHENWIQKLDVYGAVHYIRKIVGYEEYLKEYMLKQQKNWEEAKEILDFVHESTRNFLSFREWKVSISEYEESLKNAKIEQEGVQLLTMHACKGLEFSYVFLPDCNEGKVPHKKAFLQEELEEERRMFYVAMTRAKKRLEILYIQNENKKLPPSRFLELKSEKK